VWAQGGAAEYSILITAVDNDVPSGNYAANPAPVLLNRKARLAAKAIQNLRVDKLVSQNELLQDRLARLESFLNLAASSSGGGSSSSSSSSVAAAAVSVLSSVEPLSTSGTPVTVNTPAEEELDQSIHIPREFLPAFLRGVKMKSLSGA